MTKETNKNSDKLPQGEQVSKEHVEKLSQNEPVFVFIEHDECLDKLPQNEPLFKEQYERAKKVLKKLNENGELKKILD